MSNNVIIGIRVALAETITRSGINCTEYEEFDLPRTPCATIQLETGTVNNYDQQYGWKTLIFRVRNYHTFGASSRVLDRNLDEDMTTIIQILGQDRTLNGRVIDTEILSFTRMYDANPQPRYGWCDWRIEVTPYANAG
jgi:hypothetical protein